MCMLIESDLRLAQASFLCQCIQVNAIAIGGSEGLGPRVRRGGGAYLSKYRYPINPKP